MKSSHMLVAVFSTIVAMGPMGAQATGPDIRDLSINCTIDGTNGKPVTYPPVILESRQGGRDSPRAGEINSSRFRVRFVERKTSKGVDYFVEQNFGKDPVVKGGLLILGADKVELSKMDIPGVRCNIGGSEAMRKMVEDTIAKVPEVRPQLTGDGNDVHVDKGSISRFRSAPPPLVIPGTSRVHERGADQ
jgi:hypothetical protein